MSASTTTFHIPRLLAAFAILAIGPRCLARGQAEGLTVDEAVKLGLLRNPQVAGGRAGVVSARANYLSLAALPPITLGATQVQGTSTAPTLTGESNDTILNLGETLDFSGQKRYQAAGANAQFRSTSFQFQETLLVLEQQIRDAYWSLAAAQAQSQIGQKSLDDSQRVYDLTLKQEQAGSAPRGDVIRASIDLANAKQTLLATQNGERTALLALNTLLARPPQTPEQLAVDLAADPSAPPTVDLPTLADLQKRALTARPLLKSAAALADMAKYSVRQAEASRLPDVSVSYQRSVRQSVDSVQFGAMMPLLEFGSVSQSIRAAREARKQADAQRLQTEQQVLQQVSQAHIDLEIAAQAAAGYKKDILDPSVTLLDMAQLGYKQGATGILPVIDAESTLRSARVGYINSLLAVYKARDELLAAVGPSSLTNDSKPK